MSTWRTGGPGATSGSGRATGPGKTALWPAAAGAPGHPPWANTPDPVGTGLGGSSSLIPGPEGLTRKGQERLEQEINSAAVKARVGMEMGGNGLRRARDSCTWWQNVPKSTRNRPMPTHGWRMGNGPTAPQPPRREGSDRTTPESCQAKFYPSHRAAHHDLHICSEELVAACFPSTSGMLTAPASPPRPVTIIHYNRCLTACDSVMLGPLIAMLWMCVGHRGPTVCRQAPGSLSPGISGTRRNRSLSRRELVRCPVLSLFVDRICIRPLPWVDRREFRTKPRVFHPPSFRRFQQRHTRRRGRRCLRCRISGPSGVVVSRGGGTRWDGLGSDRDPMGLCHIPMRDWQTRSQETCHPESCVGR